MNSTKLIKAKGAITTEGPSSCADNVFEKLCAKYADTLPCCDGIATAEPRFRDRAKILWGRADCVDLFELKDDLLKTKNPKFKTKSLCMYPVLRKGDILKIASAKIEDIKIGDIPVYRSRDRLYAHRAVDKKIIDGKQFIITRPDTSVKLDDSRDGEKVSGEDILGKIEKVQRGRKIFSPEKRPATVRDRCLYMKIKVFSRLTAFSEKALKAILTKIQSLKVYGVLGRKLTARMKSRLNFELAVPFSNERLNRLYNYIPLKHKRVDFSRLKQAKTFHLVMKFNNIPVGCISFLRKPNECPYQGFWIADVYIRLRYRGLSFDSFLLGKTEEICNELEIDNVKQSSLDRSTQVKAGAKCLMKNSEELLLICARKDLDERLKRKAESLIKEGIDWQRFTESAMRGGVTVLVYDALRIIAPSVRIPQVVLNRLKSGYLFIVSKTISQHNELLELLKLFAQKDIPVISLKGTSLAKRLYADAAARGLNVDCDLLVKEKDKEKARILLQQAGYSAKTDNEIKQWQWNYDFSKSKTMLIDLCWDITRMYRSGERINGLWQGVRQVEENGIGFYEFNEEELLLYLSAHLADSDDFGRLKYICDINELLNQYKDMLDWNSLTEKARRWNLSNSLYVTVKLSKDLFNSNIPCWVLNTLRPNPLKVILIKLFANRKVILRGGIRRRLIDSFLSYILFELLEAKSVSEYLAIVRRVLFPPQEVLWKTRVGDGKPIFMRYIIRIFKGVFKVFRRCIVWH